MKYEQMSISGIGPQTGKAGKSQAIKLRERMEAEHGFEFFDAEDILATLIPIKKMVISSVEKLLTR